MSTVLKVHVVGAKGLPIMDSRTDSTDAYVILQVGKYHRKGPVAHQTLDPVWNFRARFELTESDMAAAESLRIVVVDEDILTADDEVGHAHVALHPLVMQCAREARRLEPTSSSFGTQDGDEQISMFAPSTVRKAAHTLKQLRCEGELAPSDQQGKWPRPAGAGSSPGTVSSAPAKIASGGAAGAPNDRELASISDLGDALPTGSARGWLPLFDSLRGVSGHVFVDVRLDYHNASMGRHLAPAPRAQGSSVGAGAGVARQSVGGSEGPRHGPGGEADVGEAEGKEAGDHADLALVTPRGVSDGGAASVPGGPGSSAAVGPNGVWVRAAETATATATETGTPSVARDRQQGDASAADYKAGGGATAGLDEPFRAGAAVPAPQGVHPPASLAAHSHDSGGNGNSNDAASEPPPESSPLVAVGPMVVPDCSADEADGPS